MLNLKYLYTHPEFKELIALVSKNKNLPAISVEKDYWVTFLLRELVNSEFNEEIVFKGGTCLSKAWQLIDRFSEDIDLLLIETEITKSTTQKGRRLKALREFVKMLPGWVLIQDNRSDLYGSFKYSYPITIKKEFPASISNSILLEPGYRGGVKPHIEKKQINSILGDELKGKLEDYDIEPFGINVLSLERIFAEKLFAITSLFNKGVLKSKTRHIYDTYKLIATKEIKALANTPEKLDLILDDISQISKIYFPDESGITLLDIKNCPIFGKNYSDIAEFKSGYTKDKELYYADAPDFIEMVDTIKEFLQII